MKLFQLSVFLILFCACKNTNSTETPKDTTIGIDSVLKADETPKKIDYFYAKVDKLRLRDKPGAKGSVLEQIKEGTRMVDLKESSDFEERIKLRDESVKAPWVKVESEAGEVGWVFGGAVTNVAPKPDFSKTVFDECEANYVKNRNEENYFKCYEKVSAQQLVKDSRYIKKTKTGYKVTLLSGKTRNLVDEKREGEDLREYVYRFYLAKMGFFVFRINRYEAGDYILMDDKFGYATPVKGMPRMSPDFRKVLIVNSDTGAGFEFNGIQLLERTDNGIETLFEDEFDGFAPHNPVWLDDKNVEFDFLSPHTSDEQWRVKAKLTQDEFGEWILTIGNRRE